MLMLQQDSLAFYTFKYAVFICAAPIVYDDQLVFCFIIQFVYNGCQLFVRLLGGYHDIDIVHFYRPFCFYLLSVYDASLKIGLKFSLNQV